MLSIFAEIDRKKKNTPQLPAHGWLLNSFQKTRALGNTRGIPRSSHDPFLQRNLIQQRSISQQLLAESEFKIDACSYSHKTKHKGYLKPVFLCWQIKNLKKKTATSKKTKNIMIFGPWQQCSLHLLTIQTENADVLKAGDLNEMTQQNSGENLVQQLQQKHPQKSKTSKYLTQSGSTEADPKTTVAGIVMPTAASRGPTKRRNECLQCHWEGKTAPKIHPETPTSTLQGVFIGGF